MMLPIRSALAVEGLRERVRAIRRRAMQPNGSAELNDLRYEMIADLEAQIAGMMR